MSQPDSSPPLLVIATRNAHKVAEIRAMLGELFAYRTLADFPGAPAVVEDGDTFEANAGKKAAALAGWLRQTNQLVPGIRAWVLADDSGLEVDALNGAPGVHSARFAALDTGADGNSPDADNNAKLLRLLTDVPAEKRTARFRCVIAWLPVTDHSSLVAPSFFSGSCEGRMDFTPRGQHGFGYDPLFIPEGFTQSFAEVGEAEKNRISHRSQALARLRAWRERNPA